MSALAMEGQERIVVFNVNWLGDVLFSTAALRALRENFPNSFIACIIPPRCLPVLEGNPHVNEIILFDERTLHAGLIAKLRFIAYLRRKRFDTAYLLHRSFSRALIVALAGIPQRIGFFTPKRSFLLTRNIQPPPIESVHRIDYYLALVRGAGLEVAEKFTEFFVKQKDIRHIEEFLVSRGIAEDEFIAVINPGGNWGPKRWPKENFARLADHLRQRYNARIIITGSAGDLPLAKEIASLMSEEPVIACGALDLKQFAVLASISDLFVSADSGPLHIANAAGAGRIIALFGPTDPAVTGPYPAERVTVVRKDIGCTIPCYSRDCVDNRCMSAVTVDDVMAAIRAVREGEGL